MRRYRFLKGFTFGLVIGVSGATVYHWDSGPLAAAPKYRIQQVTDLGPITYHPMPPGPPLREYRCLGGPKDCGTEAAVHTVPIPGTLWLVGVGLVLLWRFRRGATPPRSRPR